MDRNAETSGTDDQVQPEGRFRSGTSDDPVGDGFRDAPPAEEQWVAGHRGPGGAAPAMAVDASAATEQPDRPGPREPSVSSAEPGPLTGAGAGPAAGTGAGTPLPTDQASLREHWLK